MFLPPSWHVPAGFLSLRQRCTLGRIPHTDLLMDAKDLFDGPWRLPQAGAERLPTPWASQLRVLATAVSGKGGVARAATRGHSAATGRCSLLRGLQSCLSMTRRTATDNSDEQMFGAEQQALPHERCEK
jgi:hypothetical protein